MKRLFSADIFRLFAAIMVVTIHTDPFIVTNPTLYYLVVQVLSRMAVPFFLCIAGYGYLSALEIGDYKKAEKQLLSVVKLYCYWTIIYYLIDIPIYLSQGSNYKGIVYSFVMDFFVYGSHVHFWYLIYLIYVQIIVYIFFKMHWEKMLFPLSLILYVICTIGCAYYRIGVSVPGIRELYTSNYYTEFRRLFGMAFPFFMMGALFKKNYKMNSISMYSLCSIVYLIRDILCKLL